jgi:coproporphyrinogen III oxidase
MRQSPDAHHISAVRDYLQSLHAEIAHAFAALEFDASPIADRWERPADAPLAGRGALNLIERGTTFDRAGVAMSDIRGRALPPAATQHRPDLAGAAYEAMGVSVVAHPKNPYAPTSHMNVRLFVAPERNAWWFGGGFDLTPTYVFEDDAIEWHRAAARAADALGPGAYAVLKRNCDEYFYLKHRDETRGIGGLFFDDLNEQTLTIGSSFAQCFELMRRVGDTYLATYRRILERRIDMPFGEREQQFQWYRRGRYVEFNLVFDRGTLFGLQSGGRTESILMSMPPRAEWRYDYQPEPASPEAALSKYLRPRDWLAS